MESLQILKKLSVYVPQDLFNKVLLNPEISLIGKEDRILATVLFSDVSGFTQMSEELSKLGNEGAEEMARVINNYFERMIGIVNQFGGSIAKIAGDAITVLFNKSAEESWEENILRSLECAIYMQSVMREFKCVQTLKGNFELKMKIGISSGSVYTSVVGDTNIGLEHIVAGRTIDQSAEAEHHSVSGEILIDEHTKEIVEKYITISEKRDEFYKVENIVRKGDYHHTEYEFGQRIIPQPNIHSANRFSNDDFKNITEEKAEKIISQLKLFLPPEIYEIIKLGQTGFIGDHRRVTVLFVNFFGLDYDSDPNVGDKLQHYFVRMQRIVNKYGGRINEAEMGDKGSKLIVFIGAPTAHENNEERAILCALEMMEAVRNEISNQITSNLMTNDPMTKTSISQKIGINTGYVFAGSVGSSIKQKYTTIGDVVNLSARLMSASKDNQILVSSSTYTKVSNIFEFNKLEPIKVKGKSEKIQVYEVTGKSNESKNLYRKHYIKEQRREKIIGREKEISSFMYFLKDVMRGKSSIVSVSGEAGMGKSRLLDEFLYIAESLANGGIRGDSIFIGTCFSYTTSVPYFPWIEILKQFFEIDIGRREDYSFSEHLSKKIEKKLSEIDETFALRTPIICGVMGLNIPDNDITRGMDAKLRKEIFFDTILQIFVRQSQISPLIIVMEDAHWIDEISLELLSYISRNISRDEFSTTSSTHHRILLLVVRRPLTEIKSAYWKRIAECKNYFEINLGELSPQESIKLIQRTLQIDKLPKEYQPPDKIMNLILEKSQGNPFFIEEIVKWLIDNNVVSPGEKWNLDSNKDLEAHINKSLPDNINGVIMSRIDRLDEQSKQVIKSASVIGRLFRYSVLNGIFSKEGVNIDLHPFLEKLTRLDLTPMERELKDPFGNKDTEYFFKHILIRDVAYESLPFAKRRELHNEVAEYIEHTSSKNLTDEIYQLLAYHYGLTNNKEKKIFYWEKVADISARGYFNSEALNYYEQLLNLVEDDAKKIEIFRKRAEIFELLGDNDKSIENCNKAIELARKRGLNSELATLKFIIGKIYRNQGNYKSALEVITEAKNFVGDNALLLGQILIRECEIYKLKGEIDKALEIAEKAIDILERIGNKEALEDAYNAVGIIFYAKGDYDKSLEYYNRSLKVAEEINDKRVIGITLGNIGYLMASRRNWEQATKYLESAMKIMRDIGYKRVVGRISLNIGFIFGQRGDYEKAVEYFYNSLSIFEEIDDKEGKAIVTGNLGFALESKGDYKSALKYYEMKKDTAIEIGDKIMLGMVNYEIGNVLFLLGEYDSALSHLTSALNITSETKDDKYQNRSLVRLGELNIKIREFNKALEYLSQAEKNLLKLKDKSTLSETYYLIAESYFNLKDLFKANKYAEESISLAMETKRKDIEEKAKNVLSLINR